MTQFALEDRREGGRWGLGKVKRTDWVSWRDGNKCCLFIILSKANPVYVSVRHDSIERHLNTVINVKISLLTSIRKMKKMNSCPQALKRNSNSGYVETACCIICSNRYERQDIYIYFIIYTVNVLLT